VAAFGYVGYQAISLNQRVHVLTRANADLAGQKAGLERTSLEQTREINGLQESVTGLKADLAHPTLTQWTSCAGPCTMNPTSWRASGVPDTFKLLVSFQSTTPVAVYFFTLSQYVQFARCGDLWCVSSQAAWYSPRTSLENGYFDDAEGCGSYVVVYKSTGYGTITPNIRVQYLPADHLTGVCANDR
jgi:hypothetical protein